MVINSRLNKVIVGAFIFLGSATIVLAVSGTIANTSFVVSGGNNNLNLNRTLPAGVKQEILFNFNISANQKANVTGINLSFSGNSNLPSTYLEKLRLSTCTRNSATGNLTFKLLSSSGTTKSGVISFSKIILPIAQDQSTDLCVEGDIKAGAPAGKISLGFNSASTILAKEKVTGISVGNNIRGGQITILPTSKIPKVTFTSPKAGSKIAQKAKLSISWSLTNYAKQKNISLSLMQQVVSGGKKTANFIKRISSNSKNNGKISWTVPTDVPAGSNYFIRIDCKTELAFPYTCQNNKSGLFSIQTAK